MAKIEAFDLASDPDVMARLERTAKQKASDWLNRHGAAVDRLAEGRKQAYAEVRRQAGEPELTTLDHPETVEVRKAESRWPRHLYVDADDGFPCALNTWETDVIRREIANPNVVGWLRNPDRKRWSLCVPYKFMGETKPLFPDFVVFRRDGDELMVDVLDPHSVALEDAPAKAVGLTEYADKHGHAFGRIELIIKDGDRVRRLDLKDETTGDRVRTVKDPAHLRDLFEHS